MKAAIIADLGAGTDCIELPDVLVMDRAWLRASFGPHREESSMPTPQRDIARDRYGRVGEVMARATTVHGRRVWLRPVGGGTEWEVAADSVTPCDAEGHSLPVQEPA